MKKHILFWLLAAASARLQAQQPAQPARPACQAATVTTNGAPVVVHVDSVSGTPNAADFSFSVNLSCDPKSGSNPSGTLTGFMGGDSQATTTATDVTQLTKSGAAIPTAYATGSCQINLGGSPSPCRYWVMFAQVHTNFFCPTDTGAVPPGCVNTGAPPPWGNQPDAVVGFRIVDNTGKLIVYGAGPVTQGTITVSAPAMAY